MWLIGHNVNVKKVILNSNAIKELESFSLEVQARFYDLFKILEKDGKLEMPFAKKIKQVWKKTKI